MSVLVMKYVGKSEYRSSEYGWFSQHVIYREGTGTIVFPSDDRIAVLASCFFPKNGFVVLKRVETALTVATVRYVPKTKKDQFLNVLAQDVR